MNQGGTLAFDLRSLSAFLVLVESKLAFNCMTYQHQFKMQIIHDAVANGTNSFREFAYPFYGKKERTDDRKKKRWRKNQYRLTLTF